MHGTGGQWYEVQSAEVTGAVYGQVSQWCSRVYSGTSLLQALKVRKILQ